MVRLALFGSALTLGALAKSFSQTPDSVAHASAPNQQKLHQFQKLRPGPINEKYQPYKLGEVLNIAEDVAIFRFLFNNPDDVFSLPPCSTLQSCFREGSMAMDQVQRHYTPITPNGRKGYFDLIVKKQRHGRMTEHLFSMKVGEELSFRCIQYKLRYEPNKWKALGMIAGGTGITPMLQVMRAALDDPTDKTQLSLLYANRDHNKILLQGLIDHLAEEHPDRLKVYYTIDKMPTDGSEWTGFVGHVDDAMVRATMPPPSKENLVMLCGPDPMMVHVGGCAMGNLNTMSGANPSQGAHAGLNNLGDIPPHCVFGRLGYIKEWVYRF